MQQIEIKKHNNKMVLCTLRSYQLIKTIKLPLKAFLPITFN